MQHIHIAGDLMNILQHKGGLGPLGQRRHKGIVNLWPMQHQRP